MTNRDKLTKKGTWDLSKRCSISGATYRQALTYLVQLRVQLQVPTYNKPVLTGLNS